MIIKHAHGKTEVFQLNISNIKGTPGPVAWPVSCIFMVCVKSDFVKKI